MSVRRALPVLGLIPAASVHLSSLTGSSAGLFGLGRGVQRDLLPRVRARAGLVRRGRL